MSSIIYYNRPLQTIVDYVIGSYVKFSVQLQILVHLIFI